MKRFFLASLLLLLASGFALAQDHIKAPPVKGRIQPSTEAWIAQIEKLAPERPTAEPTAKRRVLLFSVATGYYHTVIPHVDAVIKTLAKKSGAFEVVQSDDIEMFSSEKLAGFDAVILNNTCSISPGRNLFVDVLSGAGRAKKLGEKYKSLTQEQRLEQAEQLEQNLVDYVASGKGVVCVHGAISLVNDATPFGEMIGGNFDFHPRMQQVTVELVEPDHPLLAAFGGKGLIHVDEPYMFKGPYAKKNFRPLLRMDVDKLDKATRKNPKVTGDVRYVAWIKPHGKGRVFYVSPSHQPESYETTALLRFYLDGIQYALGDLKCDDAPRSVPEPAADKEAENESASADGGLAPSVDLRPQLDRWGLGPRRQGRRPTCSVFTVAATIEVALAKHCGRAAQLSVEYLNWACNQVLGGEPRNHGQFFHNLLEAFRRHGICLERDMPYAKRFDPRVWPSKKALVRAKRIRRAPLEIHWIKPLDSSPPRVTDAQFNQIKTVLAAGWPVGAGARHSRLLVGYRDDPDQPGGGVFLTKDSGSGSYGQVTYEFVKKEVGDAFWIES
ncbi:MAG: ThuA domain-containing protein [Pirellulales bacterium]|nr:ThuA domain-containing protein [Pirellulales bacterium]